MWHIRCDAQTGTFNSIHMPRLTGAVYGLSQVWSSSLCQGR
jgi:hypothetical protein